jgi:hypothetical protein
MHQSKILTPFEKRCDWFLRPIYAMEVSGTHIRFKIDSMRLNRGGRNKVGEKYHIQLTVSLTAPNGRDLVRSKGRGERKILTDIVQNGRIDSVLARYGQYYGFDLNWNSDFNFVFVFGEEFDRMLGDS